MRLRHTLRSLIRHCLRLCNTQVGEGQIGALSLAVFFIKRVWLWSDKGVLEKAFSFQMGISESMFLYQICTRESMAFFSM